MEDQFQKAEQEYFALRGKLDVGRITREEFEAVLKEQMVKDTQGRYWTLGIDSGQWYVHDGKDWARAEPGSRQTPEQPASTAMPIASPAPSGQSNRLPIIAALGCLAIFCLVAIAGASFVILNPAAPRPTFVATPSTSGIILTTPTSSAIAAPTSDQIANAVPTSTSEPTATFVPPTDTPSPIPTATTAPAFPPGFYITALRTNPPKPLRRQDFFFDVRFLNTTGNSRSYKWLIYIYRSDPSQQKNSLGETPASQYTFPTGTGEIEIGSWRLTGAGGCEDFVARVAWLDDNKRQTFFTKTDGQVFEQSFTVCPS